MTTDNGSEVVGLKALDGYFDNLAATASNKKQFMSYVFLEITSLPQQTRNWWLS